MSEPRRYTIRLDVEVSEQDDLMNFFPGSVVGRIPALGLEWVSGTDAEALRDFFSFYVHPRRYEVLPRDHEGIAEIVRRALAESEARTNG